MMSNDKARSIIVAGSGRSGTTWISNVLSTCADTCPVFEPLRRARVPEVPQFAKHSDLPGCYLRPHEPYALWEQYFREVLHGRICNPWTRQDWQHVPTWTELQIPIMSRLLSYGFRKAAVCRYQLRQKLARHHIIKIIRGNLLLSWLSVQFDPAIVFVTRHPCAVVGSRLRHNWRYDFDDILAQDHLLDDYLRPYRRLIERATSPLEKMTVLWCVENYVPLIQLPREQWISMTYEQCLSDPTTSFERLFSQLGLQPTHYTATAVRQLVSTPSEVAGRVNEWHHPLTEKEGELVLGICGRFGIRLYGRQPEPLCNPLQGAELRQRIDSNF